MSKPIVTIERVKELLTYDPLTGVFKWKIPGWARRSKDGVAGRVNAVYGYRHICIDQRQYKAGRLAWLITHGEWPPADVDHINRVRHDDRLANLRLATRSQNLVNRKRATGNNPYRGVFRSKLSRGWWARVGKDGYLGTFPTAEEASEAYKRAARQRYGEFAADEPSQ